MRKKLAKARCKVCKKRFVTTNFDKMIMRKYTVQMCNTCYDAYMSACYKAILNFTFGRSTDV